MPNKKLTTTGGKDYGNPGLSKAKGTVAGINAEDSKDNAAFLHEYGMGGTGSPDGQEVAPFKG